MFAVHRQRPAVAAALLATIAAVLATAGNPLAAPAAWASPAVAPLAAAPGTDAEGGTPELRAALDSANRGYLAAQAALAQSKQRQESLAQQAASVEQQVAELQASAGTIATAAYRSGGLATMSALVDSGSPDLFLDRVTAINAVAMSNGKELRALARARRELADGRAAIDDEIANQQRQLDEMARRKQEAERALAAFGGGQAASGPSGSNPATATPAPRNADGSWPPESCSVDDPTTSGCITPRTLHALQQAKAAGFTHYVSCYRTGDSGEHPKGRACDFAAAPDSFGGVASGADRTYGDNLAAYFVKNADALAVLYVIWFKQIWMPSTGWRAYTSGNGDPSSDHTNHVHLSVN